MSHDSFQTVLFDWDGCLANTLQVWFDSMNLALGDFGIEASSTDLKKSFQDWNVLSELGVPCLTRFGSKVSEHLNERIDSVELNEGAVELLEDLHRKGRQLAIVTSSERRMVVPVLKRHGCLSWFGWVIDRNDVKNHKPHPEPVELALARLGSDKAGAIMIGDSSVDVLAGRAARIATAWYTPLHNREFHGHTHPSEFDPHFTVESMHELSALLFRGQTVREEV